MDFSVAHGHMGNRAMTDENFNRLLKSAEQMAAYEKGRKAGENATANQIADWLEAISMDMGDHHDIPEDTFDRIRNLFHITRPEK